MIRLFEPILARPQEESILVLTEVLKSLNGLSDVLILGCRKRTGLFEWMAHAVLAVFTAIGSDDCVLLRYLCLLMCKTISFCDFWY